MNRLARPRRHRAALAALALATLAGGCTGASSDDATSAAPTDLEATADPPPPPSATSEPSAPVSPLPSSAPDEPDQVPGGTEAVATECDEDERVVLSGVVEAQLDAFAEGDFAAARELASTTFRAGIDVETFEQLITEQYPVVLAGGDATFGPCLASDARGIVAVGLPGPDGTVDLVYLLALEDGQWRIDGAQYADTPGGGTTATPGTPV